MTVIGTLWGTDYSATANVIRTVATLNDFELNEPEFSFSNRPAEFTSNFPYGKIPAFEGADGFKLTEGLSIARYLSGLGTKVNLLGSGAQEIALVDQWVHFAEQEIGVHAYAVIGVVYSLSGPFNRETLDRHVQQQFRALDHAESHLATRPSGYLVSDTLTLADITVAAMVHGSAYMALGAEERAKYPLVWRHHDRVAGDEKVKKFWSTERFTGVAVTESRPLPLH